MQSTYLGAYIGEHLKQSMGRRLLRIDLPHDLPSLYVRDYAFQMEFLYCRRTGQSPLGLNFTQKTWKQECCATYHSYIPVAEYCGGHVAPVFTVVGREEAVLIASQFISICETQPLL